ncbi:DEAD/DEAH box helicase [Allocoleopsis franciscana]|uniref:Lhr-like helicase n=1 Tax=Allocoleopsis franciscana PCC 7113 TaxID=1173027 RepID=K9WHY9_9CYAN|nr:DEAD/DEAH box helicase [Allocoleopsis franciscana]AFZ19808.1 Lhr-like helicase [Allocoleopsis franciscana PCC 7113]
MSEQPFSRLAPFIQDYIYTHGWTELRQVQIEACQVIFDTDAHLLIAAGTASGKTEAAFLPVLTLLHQNPSETVGVLYIGPIKALINDQFERLNDLLKEADIPVWAWHGDISQSRKQKLLKNPQGVLQITPESLESLLLNKNTELIRLFGDLRFVIIDEIHAFMGSERGCQILCQLTRLSQFMQQPPRRIGLSATLGDYALAEEWLQSGTKTPVITPEIQSGQRQVRLAVEHFYLLNEDKLAISPSQLGRQEEGKKSPVPPKSGGQSPVPPLARGVRGVSPINPYYRYLFDISKSSKCLIFVNNRTQAESAIANLRQIAQAESYPDVYHVHHGSISPSLRETAEEAMQGNAPAVTAATVTLELGIDIGQLERVIQLDAPLSVASFLQRLGRTGRRGTPADMRFICTEDEPLGEEWLPAQIPWQLLQCIAIIQLYAEERWIEPIQPIQCPFSLLYHQTMSILASMGELSSAALAQHVLTLPPFAAISQDDFRQLLRYLIDIDHIQLTEKGGLLVGLTGEKIVRNFHFYAVFPYNMEYSVRDASQEIGSIVIPPIPGNRFSLAGRTWEVLEIDVKRKTAFVKQVEGIASSSWRGGGGTIHTKILERMRRVLVENIEYPYLQPQAQKRLKAARNLARSAQLEQDNILFLERSTCCIFPWMGTVAYRTLERFLNFFVRYTLDIRSIGGVSPYFLTLKLGKNSLEQLRDEVKSFCEKDLTGYDLVSSEECPRLHKYDEFIPNNLLRQAFICDSLDVAELREIIKNW